MPLASKLDVNGDTATVERDVPGGVEVLEVKLPLVLSAAKGMAEQRIPTCAASWPPAPNPERGGTRRHGRCGRHGEVPAAPAKGAVN